MKKIPSIHPENFWKNLLLLLIAMGCLPGKSSAQTSDSPYLVFDSWPITKLKGGMLVCSPYHTAFWDDFNGTKLDRTKWNWFENTDSIAGCFHCGAAATICKKENVRVANGNLMLSIVREDTAYILQRPDHQNFNAHCYQNVPYVSRNVTNGMVMMSQDLVFNLGKYEIRCKFPNKNHIWSTFWMWHHDEVDIFDLGFRAKFNHNCFHNNYTASIHQSPCCPFTVDCDYCPTNNVDCTAATDCQACGEPYWGCHFMAEDYHVVGCEWTPFKLSFYVDGVTTGTVYRYYNFDKTPVEVACGDSIPEGLVRENPAYLDIQGRGFRPEIWIATESKVGVPCDYADCPDRADITDLPATLLVDYVKIEERAYERIALMPDCYQLCDNDPSTPVCVKLESEYYNFIYDGQWGWLGPNPAPKVISWTKPANGAILPNTQTGTECCFTYDQPDCSVAPCQRRLPIQASVQTHTGDVYNLSKMLQPPMPKLTYLTLGNGTKQLCVDRDNYCGPLQGLQYQHLNGQ